MLRSSLSRTARRVPLPRVAPALARFASETPAIMLDPNRGRTPERTAELEKLAEEHNGFLFGELVRAPDARPSRGVPCPRSSHPRPRPPSLATRRPHADVCPPLPTAQPLPKGQSRQMEDWEYFWIPGMSLAFILYGTAFYFRPYHEDEWARSQALQRLAAKEGGSAAEEDEE